MQEKALKPSWRLLETIEASGSRQMAIDEAILTARSEDRAPNTLRFFRWKQPTVTIGFFQSLEQEINAREAIDLGIDVIRRYTGGGAVFHDREITYSVVVGENEVPHNIIESYHMICQGIILGLSRLGVRAEFKPINDVVVNGKKVSGNAQTRRDGVVLQHGTLLLDVDKNKMFSLLRIPEGKTGADMITSLRNELKRDVRFDEVEEALLEGFRKALSAKFSMSGLSGYEEKLALKLDQNKYSSRGWNWWR